MYMRKWVTEFQALDALTGEMKTWGGPSVDGLTANHAQDWCYRNAGHLKVIGELIEEIQCFPGTHEPDMLSNVDYHTFRQN